jgi:hypothetical protein
MLGALSVQGNKPAPLHTTIEPERTRQVSRQILRFTWIAAFWRAVRYEPSPYSTIGILFNLEGLDSPTLAEESVIALVAE